LSKGKKIIVSGADSGYFELLSGLVRSIRDKAAGAEMALGVLDVGLEAHQRHWLEQQGARVVAPGWDLSFPEQDALPRYRQAQVARPFLPRHFPGHDLYMWLDADAWVQDWWAVDLFFRAAGDNRLAIVPELDRAYRNFFHAWDEFDCVIRKSYTETFNAMTAERLVRHPVLNSGAFALGADAPHWTAWGKTLASALQRSRDTLVDQTTLNHVVYLEDLPAHFLPSWCNWICHHAVPLRDAARGFLVEPNLPHQKLGIVHLTMWMKNRGDLAYGLDGGDLDSAACS
jgi:hypothetical protein